MAYKGTALKLLIKIGAKPGDRIKVITKERRYEGILMPRYEIADRKHLVLKLKSGYNIGIDVEKVKRARLVKKGMRPKYKPKESKTIVVDKSLPTISLLGCGGTISSRIEYRTGAVYPAFSPKDLVEFVPEIKQITNIRGKKLFDIFSEDMTPDHWQRIAKECYREIKKGVDGVVITQGTDTMHYTAAALSFMLQNLPVPVVLTGAQRSSDRASCDSPMNLVCSFKAATSPIAEVMICMHGQMEDSYCLAHSGVHVRKMHSSRRDAFQSINRLPYAKVWYKKDKIEYLRKDFRKRNKKRKLKLDTKLNPNVGLVYIHPGIKPEFIKSLADHYDAVLVVGTGLGHVPANKVDQYCKPILPAIKELIENGILVVMTSQTLFGKIQMKVYSTGRDLLKAGVIPSYTLPEVALVKLMWALGHSKKMSKIKEIMTTDLVGEINKRISLKSYKPNLQ